MNWSDDLDFMSSKKLVKQGRRAENAGSPEKTELLDNAVDNISNSPPEALLRTRKTGKWADEGGKSAKNRTATNLIELERFQTEKAESDEDDIPVIPDIEEFQDELAGSTNTENLKTAGFKSTYKEIDSELIKLDDDQKFGNSKIDLSLLTSRLIPEKDCKENDDVWTMDYLFESLMRYVNSKNN
ncbi:Intraflagellar transport protein 43 [Popillia japonica]|uniref:Intraflagellar transport protein 43 n=1 Tax=Popillia japonica TaxID=7064 RepID=A0AAW1N4E6_POPJA